MNRKTTLKWLRHMRAHRLHVAQRPILRTSGDWLRHEYKQAYRRAKLKSQLFDPLTKRIIATFRGLVEKMGPMDEAINRVLQADKDTRLTYVTWGPFMVIDASKEYRIKTDVTG